MARLAVSCLGSFGKARNLNNAQFVRPASDMLVLVSIITPKRGGAGATNLWYMPSRVLRGSSGSCEFAERDRIVLERRQVTAHQAEDRAASIALESLEAWC